MSSYLEGILGQDMSHMETFCGNSALKQATFHKKRGDMLLQETIVCREVRILVSLLCYICSVGREGGDEGAMCLVSYFLLGCLGGGVHGQTKIFHLALKNSIEPL